jgi:hypothetical protein
MAASCLYNPNNNRGQIVIRALHGLTRPPRGVKNSPNSTGSTPLSNRHSNQVLGSPIADPIALRDAVIAPPSSEPRAKSKGHVVGSGGLDYSPKQVQTSHNIKAKNSLPTTTVVGNHPTDASIPIRATSSLREESSTGARFTPDPATFKYTKEGVSPLISKHHPIGPKRIIQSHRMKPKELPTKSSKVSIGSKTNKKGQKKRKALTTTSPHTSSVDSSSSKTPSPNHGLQSDGSAESAAKRKQLLASTTLSKKEGKAMKKARTEESIGKQSARPKTTAATAQSPKTSLSAGPTTSITPNGTVEVLLPPAANNEIESRRMMTPSSSTNTTPASATTKHVGVVTSEKRERSPVTAVFHNDGDDHDHDNNHDNDDDDSKNSTMSESDTALVLTSLRSPMPTVRMTQSLVTPTVRAVKLPLTIAMKAPSLTTPKATIAVKPLSTTPKVTVAVKALSTTPKVTVAAEPLSSTPKVTVAAEPLSSTPKVTVAAELPLTTTLKAISPIQTVHNVVSVGTPLPATTPRKSVSTSATARQHGPMSNSKSPIQPSREELLREKVAVQYKQLQVFLKNVMEQSMLLMRNRHLPKPFATPRQTVDATTPIDNGLKREHLYRKLTTDHRASHILLQKQLLRSAETTLRLLMEYSISLEEARVELKDTIKEYEGILYDTLQRQELERQTLVECHSIKDHHTLFCDTTTNNDDEVYPCQSAFRKVDDICTVLSRPVGRPKAGQLPSKSQ